MKLDEGVAPGRMIQDSHISQAEEPDIRDENECEAKKSEPTAIAVLDDPGNEEVELLLNGDAPEWIHWVESHGRRHGGPVAKHDNGPSSPGDFRIRAHSKCDDTEANEKTEKVERPDAQDAPDVELAGVNLAARLAFTQQQLGNEEGAESEKQAESESAGRENIDGYMSKTGLEADVARRWNNIERVVGKDKKKCEKSDEI